jgi:hypothetical protein
MDDNGYATSTIDHTWSYLNQACQYTLRQRKIKTNPVADVLLPTARPPRQHHCVGRREVGRYGRVFTVPLRLLVAPLSTTGGRRWRDRNHAARLCGTTNVWLVVDHSIVGSSTVACHASGRMHDCASRRGCHQNPCRRCNVHATGLRVA